MPSESKGKLADVLGIVGRILCVGAGLYLFTSQTQDANSYLRRDEQ